LKNELFVSVQQCACRLYNARARSKSCQRLEREGEGQHLAAVAGLPEPDSKAGGKNRMRPERKVPRQLWFNLIFFFAIFPFIFY
jgi:hypothetical protein